MFVVVLVLLGIVTFVVVYGVTNFFIAAGSGAGAANTAGNFLADLQSQNYDQAYQELDATLTVQPQLQPQDFDEQEVAEEGCLSLQGVMVDVERPVHVRVRAQDENGDDRIVEASGLEARVIQHEIDHLDGVLFIDRLSPLKRQFLRRSLEALARGEMPDDYEPPRPGEST